MSAFIPAGVMDKQAEPVQSDITSDLRRTTETLPSCTVLSLGTLSDCRLIMAFQVGLQC